MKHYYFNLLNNRIFLFLVFSAGILKGQNYPVSAISADLRKNAKVVVRQNEHTFLLYENKPGLLKVHKVITVFNESKSYHACFRQIYRADAKVKLIAAKVYDAQGKQVAKYSSGDEEDQPFSMYESLAQDPLRIKSLCPQLPSLPYTVEIIYEKEMPDGMFLPSWNPLPGPEVSCEKATFIAEHPVSVTFHWNSNQLSYTDGMAEKRPDRIQRTWKVSNLMALPDESYPIPWNDRSPFLELYPDAFDHKGFKGSMRTWEEFGDWNLNLSEGRDDIANELDFLKDSIPASATVPEKVALTYKLLQSKMHYTSIQLGIGGWQPATSKSTWENQYGDCKALSWLMETMLKHEGIECHRVLVYSGNDGTPEYEKKPDPQFNHVLLCVPNGQDTIWLECTSKNYPAGYLSVQTGNRKGLLLKKNASKLVNLPRFNESINSQHSKTVAVLKADGLFEGTTFINSSGIFFERAIDRKDLRKTHEIQNELTEAFYTRKAEIASYTNTVIPGTFSQLESWSVKQSRFATVSGNMLEIPVRNIKLPYLDFTAEKDRASPLFIPVAFSVCDTFIVDVPAHSQVIHFPSITVFANDFGSVLLTSILADDKITSCLRVVVKSGTYPPEKAADFDKLLSVARTCMAESWILIK